MSLPVLSPQFFKDHPPSVDFFQKWESKYPWQDTLLPLYEWNGILYIGCIEQPQSGPAGVNCVFVHAQSEDLSALWKKYSLKSQTSQNFELMDEPLPSEVQSTPPAEEVIEGLDLSQMKVGTTSESDDFFSQMSSHHTTRPSEEVSFDHLNTGSTPPQEDSNSISLIDIDSNTPRPSPAPIPSPQPQAYTESPSTWVTDTFDQMCTHYQKAMILLLEQNQAKPWKWSLNFDHGAENIPSIELKSPSPFRIAARTMKPYHGFLPENPITQNFLNEWNKGQKPEHFTLVPIVIADQTVGLLLGLGESNCYTKENLHLCEKLALNIAQLIEQNPQSLKAA